MNKLKLYLIVIPMFISAIFNGKMLSVRDVRVNSVKMKFVVTATGWWVDRWYGFRVEAPNVGVYCPGSNMNGIGLKGLWGVFVRVPSVVEQALLKYIKVLLKHS